MYTSYFCLKSWFMQYCVAHLHDLYLIRWPLAAHLNAIIISAPRGGWKYGYITCTILRCSRIWYDWNVNNVPRLACHHTLEEILRWLKVFYYTTAGGDRKAIIPTYYNSTRFGDIYNAWSFSVLSVEIQRQTAQSNLDHPVGERMPLPAVAATQLTLV